jgi:hypothetical protein
MPERTPMIRGALDALPNRGLVGMAGFVRF